MIFQSFRYEKIVKNYSIDFIYHCAAYKHVPVVEKNLDIFKNNFFNTHSLLSYCISKNIKNSTLISSDKAVSLPILWCY